MPGTYGNPSNRKLDPRSSYGGDKSVRGAAAEVEEGEARRERRRDEKQEKSESSGKGGEEDWGCARETASSVSSAALATTAPSPPPPSPPPAPLGISIAATMNDTSAHHSCHVTIAAAMTRGTVAEGGSDAVACNGVVVRKGALWAAGAGVGSPREGRRFCARHRRRDHVWLAGQFCRHAEGCYKRASFALPGMRPLYCKAHKDPAHININAATCEHEGCGRVASFGLAADRRSRTCAQHRARDHVPTRRQVCAYSGGCDRRGTFEFPAAWNQCLNLTLTSLPAGAEAGQSGMGRGGRGGGGEVGGFVRYCARHRPVSVNSTGFSFGVGVMCRAEGCGKHASFGSRGHKAHFCRPHKLPEHVNVKYVLCKEEGCTASARYRGPTARLPEWCARHKSLEHVNAAAGARCSLVGCGKLAYFVHPARAPPDIPGAGTNASSTDSSALEASGRAAPYASAPHAAALAATDARVRTPFPASAVADGSRASARCARHRLPGQIDFRNKLCRHEGCGKQPIFGPPGASPVSCRC